MHVMRDRTTREKKRRRRRQHILREYIEIVRKDSFKLCMDNRICGHALQATINTIFFISFFLVEFKMRIIRFEERERGRERDSVVK